MWTYFSKKCPNENTQPMGERKSAQSGHPVLFTEVPYMRILKSGFFVITKCLNVPAYPFSMLFNRRNRF
jgi:hypothetical protein